MLFDKTYNMKLKMIPSRFDMAVNFHCCVEKNNEYFVVGFYYNPAWNVFYPFYDDVNKTPVVKQANSSTFSELATECDTVLNVDVNEKLQFALNRFKEIFGCNCKVKQSNNFEMYELKYSKTANIYTVYKLFNYIIYDIDDAQKLFASKLKAKLFNIQKLKNVDLISNAIEFCKINKQELIENAIKI